MAITKEDILNAVADMSVMDVCELVKMMEENSVFLRKLLLQLQVQLLMQVLLLKKKLSLTLS